MDWFLYDNGLRLERVKFSQTKGEKKGSAYSSWNIVRGVPHRSVLGPLLFNVVINDILMFIEKVISVTRSKIIHFMIAA